MNQRFTVDGSDELERHLSQVCGSVREQVQRGIPESKLQGLMLGGGYGRGEGGVLRSPEGDLPYNDMEFYVCMRGLPWINERRYGRVLEEVGEQLSGKAGLHVEFKIISLESLRKGRISMFSYDLIMGHRWLIGNDSLLAGCEHHKQAKAIPMSEAARLMMNRCSGLLFSKARLETDPFDLERADFVGRNLAKAELGFGDAVLAAFGEYHWSCRRRHQTLEKLSVNEELSWLGDVQRRHLAGVEFKLHPKQRRDLRTVFLEEHARLSDLGLKVWLWLESKRLGHCFASARDYALSRIDKCPETSRVKNRLVNIKTFGARAGAGARASRYPRERLLNSLALLLWEREAITDTELKEKLQEELGTGVNSFSEWVMAYEGLWRKFN